MGCGGPCTETRRAIPVHMRRGRFPGLALSPALGRCAMSGGGWRVAWSCWRSFRNSSEIVRRRTINSASASVSGSRFRLLTRRSPTGHHGRLLDAPRTMAIGTPVGGDFRTGRECFGCPTGQALGSVARPRCLIHIPVTQNFPDHSYEHATFPMPGRPFDTRKQNQCRNRYGERYTWRDADDSPRADGIQPISRRMRAGRRGRHRSGSRSQGIHRHAGRAGTNGYAGAAGAVRPLTGPPHCAHWRTPPRRRPTRPGRIVRPSRHGRRTSRSAVHCSSRECKTLSEIG